MGKPTKPLAAPDRLEFAVFGVQVGQTILFCVVGPFLLELIM